MSKLCHFFLNELTKKSMCKNKIKGNNNFISCVMLSINMCVFLFKLFFFCAFIMFSHSYIESKIIVIFNHEFFKHYLNSHQTRVGYFFDILIATIIGRHRIFQTPKHVQLSNVTNTNTRIV